MLLSEREQTILRHLVRSRTSRQIADELGVSQAALAQSLRRLFQKIDVDNRSQAVDWARQNGFDNT
jgi:LuxR family transcriptional regulator, positive regulator of biofilm formation